MGELIVNGIKWAFIISVALIFMTAVTTLVSFLLQVTSTNVIGEVLGIISNCLPFSAFSVMGGLFTVCNAILSFLVAQKIYNLTSEHVKI